MPLGGYIPPQNKIVVDSLEKLQLAEEVLFGDGRGGPKVVGAAAHLRLVGLDCEVTLGHARSRSGTIEHNRQRQLSRKQQMGHAFHVLYTHLWHLSTVQLGNGKYLQRHNGLVN